MAWRNRISMKGRSQGFRKMNLGGDEDYEMPLLIRPNSLSPRNHSSGPHCFNKSPKSHGSGDSRDMNINIAAVSDDVEFLSFPHHKHAVIHTDTDHTETDSDTHRSSNNSSPISMEEQSSFAAQFDPDVLRIISISEKDDASAVNTVFDDNTSNDESMYKDEVEQAQSLRPPSITVDDNQEEPKDQDATSRTATNSIGKKSKTSAKSKLSLSTQKHAMDDNEEADNAPWKADEIDAFVNAPSFGNISGHQAMEIIGVDLLTQRDSSVNELLEANHLMTFNSLVLIQKQKDWIAGSIDATKGSGKGTCKILTMELENLERKIKLMMDSKSWPNELERKKQQANPFTPSKAFFKSMALIDKSIEQFHKGYLKHMSKSSQESHELKTRVEKLIEVNASLQEQAERSRQKNDTIRKLQKQRDDLTRTVDSTEQILASLLINAERESSPIKQERNKIYSVKAYIQRLETERSALQTEIQLLKDTAQIVTESSSNNDNVEIQGASSSSISHDEDEEKKENLDAPSPVHDENGILDGDLNSKWHTLEQNELEMSSKADQIKSLSETVAGQESALASVRAECKLMRLQLLQLETTRNDFKAQCESKDSALVVSQDRISSLEEEVIRTHAQCATYEEDYEAMRETFASQKVATKQEINISQDEVKSQIEYIREECREKLIKCEDQLQEVKEDRDRVVRDLKTSVEEIEAERDNMKRELAKYTVVPMSFEEEKKEFDEDVYVNVPPVVVSPKSSSETDFDQMRNRFVEKASKQAFAIAQLSEENEIKDEQLKSLQEMVEMLLGKRNGNGEEVGEEGGKRQWGKRISNLRSRSQQSASNLMNRSRHGSMHGSQHGSQHGELTN